MLAVGDAKITASEFKLVVTIMLCDPKFAVWTRMPMLPSVRLAVWLRTMLSKNCRAHARLVCASDVLRGTP